MQKKTNEQGIFRTITHMANDRTCTFITSLFYTTKDITFMPDWKKCFMPNMSGIVPWLCQEFRDASSVIWLAPNSGIKVAEFSVHKVISVHVTGEISPKRSRKWLKKQKKSSRKIREGAEKVNKILHASKQLNRIFKVAQKGQQNIFLLASYWVTWNERLRIACGFPAHWLL